MFISDELQVMFALTIFPLIPYLLAFGFAMWYIRKNDLVGDHFLCVLPSIKNWMCGHHRCVILFLILLFRPIILIIVMAFKYLHNYSDNSKTS
jgi:hypothetical protein